MWIFDLFEDEMKSYKCVYMNCEGDNYIVPLLPRAVAETKKMKTGDPLDRSVQHGPQNHMAHLNKLVEYCDTALKEGARLLLGGKRADRPGLYMEPTIFCDVEDHMYIAKEESFGPIMVITVASKVVFDLVNYSFQTATVHFL